MGCTGNKAQRREEDDNIGVEVEECGMVCWFIEVEWAMQGRQHVGGWC